jgi:hypothetical protein
MGSAFMAGSHPMTGVDLFLLGWTAAALLMLLAWIAQWRA